MVQDNEDQPNLFVVVLCVSFSFIEIKFCKSR